MYPVSLNGTIANTTVGAANEQIVPADYDGDTETDFAAYNSSTGARIFSWGTNLAGLPGRAGLDAGLGLSYNSLV